MSIARPWFPREDYLARVEKVRAELARTGQDALVAFLPETVTYLTGFFTRGYSSFQFAVIPLEGEPLLFCRDVEEYYLDATCVFPGRVMWTDSDDRIAVAARAIREAAGARAKLAVEMQAWTLSVARYDALRAALPETMWSDMSRFTTQMRFIKSPAEIAYQRAAGKAAEAGMAAGIASAKAGATEREMAAEICAAMIRAGSDLPGRACSLPANAPTISMEATPTGFLREATSSSSRRPRTSGIITPVSCARSRSRRRPTRSTGSSRS